LTNASVLMRNLLRCSLGAGGPHDDRTVLACLVCPSPPLERALATRGRAFRRRGRRCGWAKSSRR